MVEEARLGIGREECSDQGDVSIYSDASDYDGSVLYFSRQD